MPALDGASGLLVDQGEGSVHGGYGESGDSGENGEGGEGGEGGEVGECEGWG